MIGSVSLAGYECTGRGLVPVSSLSATGLAGYTRPRYMHACLLGRGDEGRRANARPGRLESRRGHVNMRWRRDSTWRIIDVYTASFLRGRREVKRVVVMHVRKGGLAPHVFHLESGGRTSWMCRSPSLPFHQRSSTILTGARRHASMMALLAPPLPANTLPHRGAHIPHHPAVPKQTRVASSSSGNR